MLNLIFKLKLSKMDNSKRIIIYCSHCGSDDVRRDAWAAWNEEAQEWELAEVFDAGHCNDCDGEASLKEEELLPRIEIPLTLFQTILAAAQDKQDFDTTGHEGGYHEDPPSEVLELALTTANNLLSKFKL